MTTPVQKTALFAVPMHGQSKLSREGYRTRDGHLIEWMGRLLADTGTVDVVSRPEPWPIALRNSLGRSTIAANTRDLSTSTARLPNLRDRRAWWVTSSQSYHPALSTTTAPVIAWNPFLAISNAAPSLAKSQRPIAFDLLDDWTIHYAFESIHEQVVTAYRSMFDLATSVTANSEATLDLARRHGRSDAVLLLNGCDPERFSTASTAHGPLTVGYVGKIGRRLDLELIVGAATALPDIQFVFAGPILDSEYRQPLKQLANVTLLGDVHYEKVPELLQSFDIGWVPHRVGEGEVGGDVIKTYEYRAAGLPVLTTPVLGATSRGLDEVTALPADQHIQHLRSMLAMGPRVPRSPTVIPPEATWGVKARYLCSQLGLSHE